MVKQMPLRWEARHRSEAPDPLYVTVPPPEFIHKSRVDQVLDDAHQQALDSAVMSIISTPIAEETFAQIVDGLPLRSVALGTQNRRVIRGDPIDNHPDMCPGALEKAREFQMRLNTRGLEVASAALQQYQNTPIGSKASKMPFLELVAVTIHNIAVELFKLVNGGFHKDVIWPSDEAYQERNWSRWPTPFCLLHYSKPEQYPDGIADLAGYWAEDRIFGGVVLFGRGTNDTGSTYDGIWFHSHRDDVTKRIYALTEQQTANLLQFLEKGQINGSVCPLPILADITNRRRVDEEIAIPEFNVYRDRWERTVDYRNWNDYRSQRHHCRNAIDWPEILDYQEKLRLEVNSGSDRN
ncbi:hypothetical protein KVR01_006669 [Diaporthe batatas]|uniref:uncharacterized protein n=1 Tax=Diaporthe batatas TaxID=748121 RepID=UPI001D059943|nr:uncharacterized protein KVR01_006669 [Diaporthe batatas]KAG8163372.1 hypothetical protein KVR01_006669 [Diaporthe batatas]